MNRRAPMPGSDARRDKGWWRAHRWLVARRFSQFAVLGLFLAGPWFGLWVVKGNLNASLTLDLLPLTDPYVLLQTLAAGHLPELTALGGALIVTLFYLLVGGRAYCSWVCPLNPVTDLAHWLRLRLDIRSAARLSRSARYWILGLTLLLAGLTGTLVWELVNPVSYLHRGILFGMGLGWTLILAVFLAELLVSRHAWCGHLCPVGAFYGLLGRASFIRVSASAREACNDCMDCFAVCPEPQVIRPALKGAAQGAGPVIRAGECTNCGRCIDVCSKDVFEFSTRFNQRPRSGSLDPKSGKMEVMS